MPEHRLTAWLRDHDRSQVWLAQQAGCTQAMISYIIAGRRAVPQWLDAELSDITGLPGGSFGRIFTPKGRQGRGKENDSAVG